MNSFVRTTRGFAATIFLCCCFVSAALSDSEPAFELDNYSGNVVYVDFWASWCVPCRESFPFMNELKREFGDDLVIAAINVDEKREDADKFLQDFSPEFLLFYDTAGVQAEAYGLVGMPSSYLYNRSGELVGSHVGFRKKDVAKLREAVKRVVDSGN